MITGIKTATAVVAVTALAAAGAVGLLVAQRDVTVASRSAADSKATFEERARRALARLSDAETVALRAGAVVASHAEQLQFCFQEASGTLRVAPLKGALATACSALTGQQNALTLTATLAVEGPAGSAAWLLGGATAEPGSVAVVGGKLLGIDPARNTFELVGGATSTRCPLSSVAVPATKLPSGTVEPAFCVAEDIVPAGPFHSAVSQCANAGGDVISDSQHLALIHRAFADQRNWFEGKLNRGRYANQSLPTVAGMPSSYVLYRYPPTGNAPKHEWLPSPPVPGYELNRAVFYIGTDKPVYDLSGYPQFTLPDFNPLRVRLALPDQLPAPSETYEHLSLPVDWQPPSPLSVGDGRGLLSMSFVLLPRVAWSINWDASRDFPANWVPYTDIGSTRLSIRFVRGAVPVRSIFDGSSTSPRQIPDFETRASYAGLFALSVGTDSSWESNTGAFVRCVFKR